ncbi:AAA family ATPase [Ottowia sp.]|uniref:AAA family ATPase n=1 Tax=Ottowia sp. TaxID=1898956 RepID=UPI0039E28675
MSTCPNCGTPCQSDHRYCWSCGALLHAQRELKQVTVLLADLCDSTARVIQTDAEGGQAYLDLAYQRMSAAVGAYGGTQVQWRGDELLALFGAPVAQEDHALRACLAAEAMLAAMQLAAQTAPGVPMEVRIGIHSGEVIAGPGSGELASSYRVDGAPVHLASRLERLAPPGRAYLSGSTMKLVGGQVSAQALGTREVRGFDAPVDVYELLPAPRGSAAPPARRHYLGPFLGRAEVMDAVGATASRVQGGRCLGVGIRGEAGIGKSRLVAELGERLRGLGFATAWAGARGYGVQAPYSLAADIVRALRGEGGDGDAATAEAQAHAAALADLLGTPDPGEAWQRLAPLQRRERLEAAFVWLVGAQARRQPLALLVEDVFLADERSQRLIASLAQRLAAQPLLLLMSYRPDFVPRWREEPWFEEQALGPLPPADAARLADHLMGGDPSLAPIRRALLDRAAGNPLFLEQMVMTLLDDGSLQGPPGACRSLAGTAPLKVPASIMAIIGARVDRLPADAKASLEAAAILGEPLQAALLAAVRRIEPAEAERHLQQALSGGLIVAVPFPPGTGYAFRTGLVQESVLASMTRARRRLLHRAAFEALGARADAASADAGTLAQHAFEGEHWPAAARHALAAMARALARSENKEALRLFELGLGATRRIEPEGEQLGNELALRLEALGAQMALGRFDDIIANLERAQAITHLLGDLRRQAGVAVQLAVTHWGCGNFRQGLAAATHAGEVAAAAGSRSVQMAAGVARMMHNHALGRYADAHADGTRVARDFAAELQARRLLPGWAVIASVNLATFLADTQLWRGDLAAAQAACDQGYQELRAEEHSFSRVLLDFAQGVLLMARQRPGEAAALLQASLELCRAHELSNMHPAILAHLAGALALHGRADEALALLEPAVARHASRAGGRYNEYYFPYFLAVALGRAARVDEAVAAARQACDAAASFEQRGHEARALLLLARLEALAGRAAAAAEHRAEAQTLAQECGMHWPTLEAACEIGAGPAAAARAPELAGQGHA